MKRTLSAVLLSLTMLFSSVPNVYAENTLEIEFTELDEVDADIPLLSFMQYDSVDLVAGVHGSFKIYSPSVDMECIKTVEKVEGRPNVLKVTHSGALDYFRNDEVYLLHHYVRRTGF